MNFFQRTWAAFNEVRNFLFIRKVIKQNRKSDKWKQFNLRSGYLNQIYTVINLRKEDMGEEEEIRKIKVLERVEPMHRYIEDLNLSEIMYVEYVDIQDSLSYLVIYWPLRNYFSPVRFIMWIVGIIASIKIITMFNLIGKTQDLLTNIQSYINW